MLFAGPLFWPETVFLALLSANSFTTSMVDGPVPGAQALGTDFGRPPAVTLIILSVLIGIVAGLRTMTVPAAVAVGARYGAIAVAGTPLAFMGYTWTPWIFCALAIVELITDQLPTTPSRKAPAQFTARVLSGALSGATLAATQGSLVVGLIAGIIGAVIGTLGGAALRARLAAAFGKDRPAALIEDVVAIGGAALLVLAV